MGSANFLFAQMGSANIFICQTGSPQRKRLGNAGLEDQLSLGQVGSG
jgi:hypothetical protein